MPPAVARPPPGSTMIAETGPLLIYAIGEAPAPSLSLLPGVAGLPVSWLESGSYGVWASVLPAPAEPGRRLHAGRIDLLRFHQVVETISAAQTCLPVRFGTVVAGIGELQAALAAREPAIARALDRVRGGCEVAITALWQEGEPAGSDGSARVLLAHRSQPVGTGRTTNDEGRRTEDAVDIRDIRLSSLIFRLTAPERSDALATTAPATGEALPAGPTAAGAGPGRRYLEARRAAWRAWEQRRRRAAQLAEQVARTLGVEPSGVRHVLCPSPRVAFSSAYLVPRVRAGDLLQQARELKLSEISLHFHGPWPPYSFAALEAEAAGPAAGVHAVHL
jgi:hypothetical protein